MYNKKFILNRLSKFEFILHGNQDRGSFETEQASVHYAYDLKANHINRLHDHTIKMLIFIYQKYGQIPDLNDSLLM